MFKQKKGAMIQNFLISLLIAIFIFIVISSKASDYIHGQANFAADEMIDLDNTLQNLVASSTKDSVSYNLQMGDNRIFYYIEPNKQDLIYNMPLAGKTKKTLTIKRSDFSDISKGEFCYCDKHNIKSNIYKMPLELECSKAFCFDFDKKIKSVTFEEFFGDLLSDHMVGTTWEGGFFIIRITNKDSFTFQPRLPYNTRLVLQKIGDEINVCLREEGLCEE